MLNIWDLTKTLPFQFLSNHVVKPLKTVKFNFSWTLSFPVRLYYVIWYFVLAQMTFHQTFLLDKNHYLLIFPICFLFLCNFYSLLLLGTTITWRLVIFSFFAILQDLMNQNKIEINNDSWISKNEWEFIS